MLLTVIDLAERGALADNRIRYEDTLEGFAEYAEAVRPDSRLKCVRTERSVTFVVRIKMCGKPLGEGHGRAGGHGSFLQINDWPEYTAVGLES